jgi:tetratricopeptide (TPR) repeat protein
LNFYNRTEDDKLSCIHRCYFEADHGNIYDALERIKDLQQEFPNDPKINFAEAQLKEDFLGQGVKSRELYKNAYDLDNNHFLAIFHLMDLSPDEDEFRKWANILFKTPNGGDMADNMIKMVKVTLKDFDSGLKYFNWLIGNSQLKYKEQSYGSSASGIEIALINYENYEDIDEVDLRRNRAESWRLIDKEADAKIHNYGLSNPNKRLSLMEAYKELENVIEIDEYDAELWNLKSAWAYLLDKSEDSIKYAEKAIKLRPHNYPKPYHNKALAYSKLKMYDNALKCAKKARLEAKNGNFPSDVKMADSFMKDLSYQKKPFEMKHVETIANTVLIYTHKFSDKYIKLYNLSLNDISKFILKGINKSSTSQEYINLMAELLSTFPSETVFRANLNLFDRGKFEINEKCLIAALYLATHSEGMARRDAGKFILISILANFKVDKIREIYRRLILAPSEAASNELSQLNNIMIQEINLFGSVGPEYLYESIVKQNPITPEEMELAQKEILKRFIYLNEPPEDLYLLFGGPDNSPSPKGLKLGSFINRFRGNRKRL